MTSPLISVCMPCFNAEAHVATALDSVLAQTWSQIEIIAVNDGSTDRTGEILESYRALGVHVLHQQNKGQCSAANNAFAQAKGELIKFFDADDILAPDMIELQVASLSGRHDAIAMGEWARFYSEPSEAEFQPLPMYRNAEPSEWLTAEWSHGEPMMQCALWLIPRNLIEQADGWDERLSLINDFEFFTRLLLKAQEIVYARDARLYYRSGIEGSLSGQKSRKAVESQFLSLTLGVGHLLKCEDNPRTRRACANILKAFDYEHYPHHPDLRAKICARVAELGGADIEPSGPPGFQKLRPWVGWKAARRAQRAAERIGINASGRC
ncbi:glycosyltransferase family 2 protein [Aurantiacibacter hainanensis]|uniref:glycosyltransferase family 2 protein n=1 Tax=Aurantiacibacter hainanensis TaxID=3076114 RepID=UPI0030C6F3B5